MMWQSHVIQATLTVEATLQQGVLPFTIPQDSSDTGASTAKGTLFGWQNNGHLKLMDVGGHSRPPKKKDRQVPTYPKKNDCQRNRHHFGRTIDFEGIC